MRPTAGSTRYGAWAVLISRCLPIIRTFISLPAGIARMPFWRFTVLTVIGCIPWVLMLTLAGRAVGDNWEDLQKQLHYFDYALVVAIVGGASTWWCATAAAAPRGDGISPGRRRRAAGEGRPWTRRRWRRFARRARRGALQPRRARPDRGVRHRGLRQPRGLAGRGPGLRGLPAAPAAPARGDPRHPHGGPRGGRRAATSSPTARPSRAPTGASCWACRPPAGPSGAAHAHAAHARRAVQRALGHPGRPRDAPAARDHPRAGLPLRRSG